MTYAAPVTEDTVTIEIVSRTNSEAAPDTLIFGADLSGTAFDYTPPSPPTDYFDPSLEYYYFWNFGETYDFNTTNTVNLGWNASGTAIGAKPSHTFRQTAIRTVTVSVWGYVSGVLTEATGSLEVTIGNPDTYFSGTNTIFLTNGADFTEAPAGANQQTGSDLAAIFNSLVRGQETTPKRIILQRGDTFSFGGGTLGNNCPSVTIEASSGAGAKPIVNCTAGWTWIDNTGAQPDRTKDIVLSQIDWIGPFGSTTYEPAGNTSRFFFKAGATVSFGSFIVDGCAVNGWYDTLNTQGAPLSGMLSMNDCDMSDFGHGCVKVYECDQLSVVGCRVGSHASSKVKPTQAQYSGFNGGFPLRGSCNLTVFSKNETLGRQGWSNGLNGFTAYQLLRFNSEGWLDAEVYITNNVFEGGFNINRTNGTPNPAKMAMVDSNYILGNWNIDNLFQTTAGGTVVRNNIGIWPDTTRVNYPNPQFGIWTLNGQGDIAINTDAPMKAYNNTYVMLRQVNTADQVSMGNVGGAFTDIYDANHVFHEPNKTTPRTPDIPLVNSGTQYFTPREIGYKDEDGVVDSDGATPASDIYSYAPQAGSAAIGAATGVFAEFDIFGTRRADPPSRGAVEPV